MPKQSTTKTTQISIPPTSLPIGEHGPFTSGALPPTTSGYEIDFNIDSSWPVSGDVLRIEIDQSDDSGATWAFDASLTLSGIPLYDASVQYGRFARVQFGGAFYQTLFPPPTAGVDPTNTTYWEPMPAWFWNVGLDNQGSPSRKLRFSLNVQQACKLGAAVSSLS